jgi:hypothetical protein
MLQASISNVSSVFLDVCCKCVYLDQMFHLFFQTYVASVFIWMLHMFHKYIANILSRCYVCFIMVFKCISCVFVNISDACFKCFICLWTYVASVASRCYQIRSSVASPSSLSVASPWCLLLPASAGHPPPHPPLLDAGDVRGGAGPAWARETAWEMDCRHIRLDTPLPLFSMLVTFGAMRARVGTRNDAGNGLQQARFLNSKNIKILIKSWF